MRRRGSLCGEWAVGVEGVWQRGLAGKSRPCLEWKSCPVCQSKQLGGRGWRPGSERPSVLMGEGVQAGLKRWLMSCCSCVLTGPGGVVGKGHGPGAPEALGLGARAEVGGGLAVG